MLENRERRKHQWQSWRLHYPSFQGDKRRGGGSARNCWSRVTGSIKSHGSDQASLENLYGLPGQRRERWLSSTWKPIILNGYCQV